MFHLAMPRSGRDGKEGIGPIGLGKVGGGRRSSAGSGWIFFLMRETQSFPTNQSKPPPCDGIDLTGEKIIPRKKDIDLTGEKISPRREDIDLTGDEATTGKVDLTGDEATSGKRRQIFPVGGLLGYDSGYKARTYFRRLGKKPIVLEDQDEETMVDEVVVEGEGEAEKSAEPTGETCSNLVMRKLLRGARYFDPPDASWVTCYSCGEQGHITVNCPTPTKRRKPCFICSSLEHEAKQSCLQRDDRCNKGGHRAKHFPDKYKSGSKDDLCLRCGGFGHDMILCKYEYSKEDLKDIQCYVCKSFGHLCCVEPANSQSWVVSCYICGQLGHTGLTCSRHYDETNKNDSVSPSCCKCGEAGHFKRGCPNSCGLHFPENTREEGTSSRECANSSSIRTSRGRDSRRFCYNCRLKGHFARECPNSCGLHFPENTREEGTFSRECANSSSIKTSRGRDSRRFCYNCRLKGHFARECPNTSQDKLDIYLAKNSNLMQCIDQLLSQ